MQSYLNKKIQLKSNRIDKFKFKNAIKLVFSNWIFILFSFINLLLPFYATIIASTHGDNGVYFLVSVGLSTSFITIFNQFIFLIAVCIVFVYFKNKRNHLNTVYNPADAYLFLFLISLISIGLFILTSYIYTNFSTSYQNFKPSSTYGLKFILSLCPSLFFNSFIYHFIINQYNNNNKKISIFLLISFFILNLIFIPIFYNYLPFNNNNYIIGIGIGFTFSSFLIFIIILSLTIAYDKFKFLVGFKWENYWLFSKKIIHFSINFLLSTFMKIFLIMAISLALGLGKKDTIPELMIAKIVWYNSLFFCGFFADGLLYSIEYTRLINYHKGSAYRNDKDIWTFFIILSGIITLIICVVFNAAVMNKITDLYTSHQNPPIKNPLPNWPYQFNGQAINNYLWSPNGSYNYKLVVVNNGQFGYEKSAHYAIMYTTIYHVLINMTKIMSIKKLEINQKFKFKEILINFITIALIMTFIVVFSVVPDSYSFNKVFGGIDAFSFSLMIVSILMFFSSLAGYLKPNKRKTNHVINHQK